MSRRAQISDEALGVEAIKLAMQRQLTHRRLETALKERYGASAAKGRLAKAVKEAETQVERSKEIARRESETGGVSELELLPPPLRSAVVAQMQLTLVAIRDVQQSEAERFRCLDAGRAADFAAERKELIEETALRKAELASMTQERDELQARYDRSDEQVKELEQERARLEGTIAGLRQSHEQERNRLEDRVATLEGALAQHGNGGPP